MPKQDTRVTFLDGYAKGDAWIILAATPVAMSSEGIAYTRTYGYKDGVWNHVDFPETLVASVVGVKLPGAGAYFLGRDGRFIHVRPNQSPLVEQIPDAGTGAGRLGPVRMMNEIDGRLYVCGTSGQIYARSSRGWVHFDEGVLDPRGAVEGLSLYCIDGSSAKDIYAAGQRGLLYHYNGKSWRRLEAVVHTNLNWVYSVSADLVYLCGDAGAFFRGNRRGWENFSAPEAEDDFWCIEIFRDKVYLAGDRGIYVFDGKKTSLIDTGLDPAPDGHRLHAADNVLWSFGVYHLANFDGKKWRYVKHPDNP
ncbi:MAG: hypothetical protein HYZ57_21040 [Acidobacteria bacterium]|nr:hypothetical protein [Acidobacteriota bacterium]